MSADDDDDKAGYWEAAQSYRRSDGPVRQPKPEPDPGPFLRERRPPLKPERVQVEPRRQITPKELRESILDALLDDFDVSAADLSHLTRSSGASTLLIANIRSEYRACIRGLRRRGLLREP